MQGQKNKNDDSGELWRILAKFGFSSLNLGITILGGYYIGSLLEKGNHWKNATLIGVFAGLILGLIEVFTLAFRAGAKK